LFSGSWTTRRLIQTALKAASTAAAPAQDLGVAASGHLLCVAKKAEVLKCPLCFRKRQNYSFAAKRREGSKADIRTAKSHVRFTPESGHSSAPLAGLIASSRTALHVNTTIPRKCVFL
jgi:hypothetical protein